MLRNHFSCEQLRIKAGLMPASTLMIRSSPCCSAAQSHCYPLQLCRQVLGDSGSHHSFLGPLALHAALGYSQPTGGLVSETGRVGEYVLPA
jgi:hypothetical protein